MFIKYSIGQIPKSYRMFIKYSTSQIPPKKSRGKGSQWKKTADTHVADVDVSEESEPEPAKKKTSSKRRVTNKVTLSTDDNIIFDDPDAALELGKSINKTKTEEEEAARRRKASKVTSDPPKKLKGVPSLTLEEQEATNTMQALKKSRKTSRRQLGTRGSSKGTGNIPGVLDESIVISATLSEGTDTQSGVLNEEKKDDKDRYADDEGDDHISNTQDADDEDAKIESDKDEIYKYKIRVHKYKDVEMSNAEVKDSDKGNEKATDAAKADAEKTLEVKHDAKNTELSPISSSLSLSLGFSDQFLKLSSDSSLVSIVNDTIDAEINSLLEVKIQSEVPHIESPSMLRVPVFVISKPSVLTPI
ncbi:hypothetical protein Tco_0637294 [Tanacetum coccineum]